MSKVNAIFLVEPEYLVGENVQNAHVFDGSYDISTNKWSLRDTSRCGKLSLAAYTVKIRQTDSKEFCHEVVDRHYSGKSNVCGVCMASFFADED